MAGRKGEGKGRGRGKGGLQRRRGDPRQLSLFEDPVQGPPLPSRSPKSTAIEVKRVETSTVGRPAILTPPEAALYLNVKVSTLKKRRSINFGPPARMRGARMVGYLPADLEAFVQQRAQKPRKQR
ncbi:MAG TPA: helix-turn-helix domain-containing protein [Caulobacterales bacterium]|nr:helix-turn-helix domain-containing protein [Caulobacterales bacterium]